MKLTPSYYLNENVVDVAKDMLGKVIVSHQDGILTSGMIVETEAYSYKEKGCHAYGGKRTSRTKVMFEVGGIAYVYLCYGIHHLFNIVTNQEGLAEAVLIRAIEPIDGIAYMLKRRGVKSLTTSLSSGPGKLTQALGIDLACNAADLSGNKIWLQDSGSTFNQKQIKVSTRIGIAYAEEDAGLPWRFTVKESTWLSKP